MSKIDSLSHKVRGKLMKWKSILNYNLPPGQKVYLIGTPVHTNVGDSAIALASLKLLRECYPKPGCVKEMDIYDYKFFGSAVHRACSARGQVFGQGGGNMGNQYRSDERLRREIVSSFLPSAPLIFPQTIYYTDSKNGRAELEKSIEIYNHPEVTIAAREQTSYEMMRRLYPRANILLTPDIVLSTTASDYGVQPTERSGILWCMRSDVEKSMSPELEDTLLRSIEKYGRPIRNTDMIGAGESVSKEYRMDLVRQKMQEFASSDVVITDRLHGMIFAAITGTPCLVFGNYNHKVRGSYEWISHLPYIRFTDSVADAERHIPELFEMNNCRFDNTPLLPYFQKLKEAICKEKK